MGDLEIHLDPLLVVIAGQTAITFGAGGDNFFDTHLMNSVNIPLSQFNEILSIS